MDNSIMVSHMDFLGTLLPSIVKGVEYFKGTLYQGILYILVSDGILYTVDVANYFPTDIIIDFDKKEKEQVICFPNKTTIWCRVISVVNYITRLESQSILVYHDPELRNNEEFESIIAAKTTDGSGKLNIIIDNHSTFMILYKSIFGISKQDSVSLEVYNIGIDDKLLSTFKIHKKKSKLDIKLQFIFIDMNRR